MTRFKQNHPNLLVFSLMTLFIPATIIFTACQQTVVEKEPTIKDSAISGSVINKPLQTVRFLPYWYSTAQFAGYLVGREKGIFKKHGINLEILNYDQHLDIAGMIRDRKADITVSWLVNAVKMRDNGLNVINIAQFSFRSSLMLITKKQSGIKTLADMDGRRAGIWQGYELQPQALFHKYKLKVTLVPIGSTNNLFLRDGVEITNANKFDEYHTILNSGYDENELNTFYFYDYGFNFLEDGLYCLSDFAIENPDLCRDFTLATLESWDYAFRHQEEAIKIVIANARKMNFPVNSAHQKWILRNYMELYIPEGSDSINTTMTEKDYLDVASIMLESGLISRVVPFDTFYIPVLKNHSTRK